MKTKREFILGIEQFNIIGNKLIILINGKPTEIASVGATGISFSPECPSVLSKFFELGSKGSEVSCSAVMEQFKKELFSFFYPNIQLYSSNYKNIAKFPLSKVQESKKLELIKKNVVRITEELSCPLISNNLLHPKIKKKYEELLREYQEIESLLITYKGFYKSVSKVVKLIDNPTILEIPINSEKRENLKHNLILFMDEGSLIDFKRALIPTGADIVKLFSEEKKKAFTELVCLFQN